MQYGVFTSKALEMAVTRRFALCLYARPEEDVLGMALYEGGDGGKTLTAVCERHKREEKTAYAFFAADKTKHTNDPSGLCQTLGLPFSYDPSALSFKEEICLAAPYAMPTVSGAGIADCLRLWRKGTSFRHFPDGFSFQLVTEHIEYVFSLQANQSSIYCGASVNIPCESGLFGGGQYFRLRHFNDNSAPFCGFFSDLGKPVPLPQLPELSDAPPAAACSVTHGGLFWPVLRHSEEEIVLAGCGGDEYVYRGDTEKYEYFAPSSR